MEKYLFVLVAALFFVNVHAGFSFTGIQCWLKQQVGLIRPLKVDLDGGDFYDDDVGIVQFVEVPIRKSIRNFLRSSPDSLLATQLIGGCWIGCGLLLLYSSHNKKQSKAKKWAKRLTGCGATAFGATMLYFAYTR